MSEPASISVIIPTYNSNPIFLEEAIRSVLDQPYHNIEFMELIIVDDGSCKKTQACLYALKEKYAFKLFILEQNSGGPSNALNKGLREAKGKYIALCAHDDYWLPNKIQKQMHFLINNPHIKVCYGNSLQQVGNKILKRPQCFEEGDIFNALLLQKFCIVGATVMFQKDFLDTVGFYDESVILEDLDMWLRMAFYGHIGYVRENLAVYRVHSENTHVKNLHKILKNKKQVLNKWQHTPFFHAAYQLNDFYDSIHYGLRTWWVGFLKCLPLAFDRNIGAGFFLKRSIKLFLILIKRKIWKTIK